MATVISSLFFLLKEPVRGRFDREAMGANEEVANREQKPVSLERGLAGRGQRRHAAPHLVRHAVPRLGRTAIQGTLMAFYYADEFGARLRSARSRS